MKPRLLFHAGGECLTRYGTLVRRTSIEEDVAETFTRSGSAWSRSRGGVLVAAGANIPRVEWVTVDGVSVPALLLEPGRTNLFTQSDDLTHANWSVTGISTRTANQATGPYGTATLDALVENSSSSWHAAHETVTITADANVAVSAWVTANTRSYAQLVLRDAGATTTNYARAKFDLTNGTVTSSAAGGTGAVVRAYVEDWTDVAAGLYRIVLVGSVGNSATSCLGMLHILSSAGGNETYTGDGSSSIYAGALQIEDSALFASSYIPTTTTSASREAETLYVPFPHAPQGMTAYGKIIDLGASRITNAGILHIGGGSSSGDPRLQVHADGSGNYVGRHDNGVANVSSSPSAAISYGDVVEYLLNLAPTGAVTFSVSINSAAAVAGSQSGAAALGAAWNNARAYIGSRGGAERALAAHLVHKVAAGSYGFAEMRSA